MPIIRPVQFQTFQEEAEKNFSTELRIALTERYPHVLPRFPENIQEVIISNMLGRAKKWGITWQSSLSIFAELMLAIAPNFDEGYHFKRALQLEWLGVDRIVKTLDERVPDEAWELAEANSEDLPLYISPDMIDTDMIEQTAAAIPVVLWDYSDLINPLSIAEEFYDISKSYNLLSIKDSVITLIACRMSYGRKFLNPETYPWLRDVFNNNRVPREMVAMLKYRIALDFGRFV
jgi:hypothetical protein